MATSYTFKDQNEYYIGKKKEGFPQLINELYLMIIF